MIYDILNPAQAMCVFFDGRQTVAIKPGEMAEGRQVSDQLVGILRRTWPELVFTPIDVKPYKEVVGKTPLRVNGMNGLGDCIHQRSVMRELMKTRDVWLATCHWHAYHDLIEQGLKLIFQPTKLRAQAKTIERERALFARAPPVPSGAHEIKLWYRKDQIDRFGSITEAMHGVCDVSVPVEKIDFSLPAPASWREQLDAKVRLDTGGKPIMVLRPIVLRREWNSANRNPDPEAYQTLYEAAREAFYTVSVADIQPPEEAIEGPELDADLKLHHGELTFQEMAALWERADVVFANAGFGPVLAQAVGTPSVVVYGGRESYRTTDRAGAHLAPTLGIDPISPCDCHTERCDAKLYGCTDKKIDIQVALDRVRSFVAQYRMSRPAARSRTGLVSVDRVAGGATPPSSTLIFATVFVDCRERQKLTEQWLTLTSKLNPDCDLLLVDSASPMGLTSDDFAMPPRTEVFNFGDNVGHLSRKGRDGWGRAFCKGLEVACERGYRHVVHIEGDSLLRVPVKQLIDELTKSGKGVGSIVVKGMEREYSNWVETGLMVFTTDYLRHSKLTAAYDWPKREVRPTPELVLHGLIGSQLHRLNVKGRRGDKNEITHDNIVSLDLDWVTHCHNDIWVYDRFMEAYCPKGGEAFADLRGAEDNAPPQPGGLKLNLGCGMNKLDGWLNHDADVDITKALPWADGAASFIFIEHCVEHVSCHEAIRFFEEAHRVLAPSGVLRVVVPSIEQIRTRGAPDYFDFTKRWGGEATLHGALKAIIFAHGHRMIWTASVMREALLYAGFAEAIERSIGVSPYPELVGVEGHGKVIGDRFNAIESMVFEARKAASNVVKNVAGKIAVVVGGATSVEKEMAATHELLCRASHPDRATWFVVNDMIPRFHGECVAITLHPANLRKWLPARAGNRHPKPTMVWCHRKDDKMPEVTHAIEDWRGSSGLFAVRVARHLGYDRIILCGVPMSPEIGNIRGTKDWKAAQMFRTGWLTHNDEIAPFVRSWSGWTRQLFGAPDEAFLGLMAAA